MSASEYARSAAAAKDHPLSVLSGNRVIAEV